MPLVSIADLDGDPAEVLELTTEATNITHRYERFLAELPRDGNTRKPGIHASEIRGCKRRVVYSILRTDRRDESDGIWRRRFQIGHAIHEMFQKSFKHFAAESVIIDFEEEVPIAPELHQYYAAKWDIYSHSDGIFTIRHAETLEPLIRVILEIKSASPDEFEKMRAPKPEHIDQAHVYMACLDVPFTWFLYYNKGNQNYTGADNPSFFVRFDPKKWEELELLFAEFHEAAALNVLPERTEGMLCEICPYAWTCSPKYMMKKQGVHIPHKKWAAK